MGQTTLNVFVILFLLSVHAHVNEDWIDQRIKCDINEILPSQFKGLPPQYADTEKTSIKIIVTQETINQIESRILRNILELFFNFKNIEFLSYPHNGVISTASSIQWFMDEKERLRKTFKEGKPIAKENFLIYLDAHMPILNTAQYDHVKEKGLINDEPGWYGVYIAEYFLTPDLMNEKLDWKIFQFGSAEFRRFSVNQVSEDDFLIHYISSNCNNACPIIVAQQKYAYYIHKLTELAETKNLSVQIVEPKSKNFFNFSFNNESYPFFILSMSLSEELNEFAKYKRVGMPLCNKITPTEGCPFHQVSRVKLVSESMDTLDTERLGGLLNNIQFSTSYEQQWLSKKVNTLSLDEREKVLENLACEWMRNNMPEIEKWTKNTTLKNSLEVFIFSVSNDFVLQAAIDITLKDINDSKMLMHSSIMPRTNTDGCTFSQRIIGEALRLTNEFKDAKADVIIGPWCSESLKAVEEFAINEHIPLLNYAASGFDASERNPNSTLFSVYGDTSELLSIIPEIMHQFGWKRLAAITIKGETHTNYITKIRNEENKLDIFNQEITEDDANIKLALEDIKNSYRITWVDVKITVYEEIMCQAIDKEMTLEHGFVWITPQHLTSLIQNIKNNTCVCECEKLNQIINGTLIIQRQRKVNDQNIELWQNMTVRKWWKRLENRSNHLRDNYAKSSEPTDEASYEVAGYLRDSLWVFAKVVAELEKTRPEIFATFDYSGDRSKAIIDTLQHFSMANGVTGSIDFQNNNGSRKSNFILSQVNCSLNLSDVGIFKYTKNETILTYFSLNSPFKTIPLDRQMCTVVGFNVECADKKWIEVILLCTIILVSSISTLGYYNIKRYIWYKRTLNKINPSIFKMLKETQVPYKNLTLNKENILGQGEFGSVLGGTMKEKDAKGHEISLPVAVKYLKNIYNCMELRDFLLEAESLITLNHQNIIKLIGLCIDEKQICIILEYMEQGDLRSNLIQLKERNYFLLQSVHQNVYKKKLTKYAADIARALTYLESQKKLHRDIACRNVLVHADDTAKLADFGFARDMCDSGYYRFERKGKLPLRWMSPEAIREGRYSTASDVWSYGVLIYEMITLGKNPYFQYYDEALKDIILGGTIIELPLETPLPLKKLLKQCWEFDPEKRPKSNDLLNFFITNPMVIEPTAIADNPQISHTSHNQLTSTRIPLLLQRQLSDDSGYVHPRSEIVGRSSTGIQYATLRTHPFRQNEALPTNEINLNHSYLSMERIDPFVSENEEYLNMPSSAPLLAPSRSHGHYQRSFHTNDD